jgi:hypothetical protein
VCAAEDEPGEGGSGLQGASSGGFSRMGPSALVRAVGRALRSVVGGDSDDSAAHAPQQPLVPGGTLVVAPTSACIPKCASLQAYAHAR